MVVAFPQNYPHFTPDFPKKSHQMPSVRGSPLAMLRYSQNPREVRHNSPLLEVGLSLDWRTPRQAVQENTDVRDSVVGRGTANV